MLAVMDDLRGSMLAVMMETCKGSIIAVMDGDL